MKFNILVAAAVLTGSAAPAFADGFYVVQDAKTKSARSLKRSLPLRPLS